MIRDLSESLKAILLDKTVSLLDNADVVFDRPTDPFNPGNTTIDLFLYDVRENTELRSNEYVVERRNHQSIVHPPPLRLNCSYLVTAWPHGGSELALQEHRLLTQVLRTLGQFPTIPAKYLQGGLVGQDPPLPMMTLHPDTLKTLSEFWTSVGNKLRASLTLTATISVPLYGDVPEFVVTTRSTAVTPAESGAPDTWLQVGGRVMDLGAQGIPGALVEILDATLHETGLRETSDADGRFSFLRVPAGTQNLRAVAAGFQVKTQQLVVPGRPEDYEITLAPLP
jgi:Pvc16 N-terminal domain/Carboxypeptidase regulatory-like domain